MSKIKIDAPRVYAKWPLRSLSVANYIPVAWLRHEPGELPSRIVRESDWLRIMAVVRAADTLEQQPFLRAADFFPLEESLAALRAHLEKRK